MRRVRRTPAPTPDPKQARTWKCERCHGTLHAGRGQTVEAVAEVHRDSCPRR